MTIHVIVALCAFLLSLLGTRIAILSMRARRANLGYDNLSGAAKNLIPSSIQGGGIVLVFAITICMAVIDIRYEVLLPLLLLASLSLLERLMPVPWLMQMVVQIFSISIPLSTMSEPTFGGVFPAWFDILIVSATWMWFINMLRGMDDADGFAASAVGCVSASICVVTVFFGEFPSILASNSLIIASAACGFLWWNWPPAKIAMGRVGTVPLGFLLGYVLLMAVRSGYGEAMLIICAYYISESLISWSKRTWKNKPLSLQHQDHFYQKALRNGRNVRFVLRSVIGIHILLTFLAVQALLEPELAGFYMLMAYLLVGVLLGYFYKKKSRNIV